MTRQGRSASPSPDTGPDDAVTLPDLESGPVDHQVNQQDARGGDVISYLYLGLMPPSAVAPGYASSRPPSLARKERALDLTPVFGERLAADVRIIRSAWLPFLTAE